jgi:hypothetical protein
MRFLKRIVVGLLIVWVGFCFLVWMKQYLFVMMGW